MAPRARAIPAGRVSSPSVAIAMAMPTVAADDWTRPVNTAPAKIPNNGCSMFFKNTMKGSYERRGIMAELMIPMPKKTIPSPIIIIPKYLMPSVFAVNVIKKPTAIGSKA